MDSFDSDLVQLQLAHLYTSSKSPSNARGIIFHHDVLDENISIKFSTRTVSHKFEYFSLVQPYQYAYVMPEDRTLGCYFSAHASGVISVTKADGTLIPFKWIIPRANPLNVNNIVLFHECIGIAMRLINDGPADIPAPHRLLELCNH